MMAFNSHSVPEIPQETFHIAREVYHIDHIYLLIGDHLEDILTKVSTSELDFSASPGRNMGVGLAMVTAFQYAERIPDPMAAQATMKRMDWKYALHLPAQHPGYPAGALCHFRQNLFSSARATEEMRNLLNQLGAFGLFSKSALKSLQPDEVLISICYLTRLSILKEQMKAVLSLLSANDPGWLRKNALPHWYSRYQTDRLGTPPDQKPSDLQDEIQVIEADICHVMSALSKSDGIDINSQPEIKRLRCFMEKSGPGRNTTLSGRPDCANCSLLGMEIV